MRTGPGRELDLGCLLAFARQGADHERLLVVVNCASNQSQCYVRLPFTDLGNGHCRICSEMLDTIGMATTLYRTAYTWIWLLGVTTCSTCKSSVRRNVGRAAQLYGP
jgi:hypothetical protein